MAHRSKLIEMEELRQDLKEESYAKATASLEPSIKDNETLIPLYMRSNNQVKNSLAKDNKLV